ncbi:MAG TPA: hypothetical protein VLE27_07895 [Thermoanaerobaculia bacterium]|nr:hypothetical protein [Thermoanaerobaculia bacterium]
MNLGSVLSLKAELLEEDWTKATPQAEATTAAEADIPSLARIPVSLGVLGRDGEYQLAVRAEEDSPDVRRVIEIITERAKEEVDVLYIGRVVAQQDILRTTRRPLELGCSCAHRRTGMGSIGCFVKRSGDPGVVYILSNNHVLARENLGNKPSGSTLGDPVLQPSRQDLNGQPESVVAHLVDFVELEPRDNLVDIAIAALADGIHENRTLIEGLGSLSGQRNEPLETDDIVFKAGRTTGLTRGKVRAWSIGASVLFDNGRRTFEEQIEIVPDGFPRFSDKGDSGALVVDDQHRAAGLLFSGSDGGDVSYANQIGNVLTKMKVSILF